MLAFKKDFPYFKVILRVKTFPSHEAKEYYRNELAREPDSLTANLGLGLLWQESSEFEHAIKYFKTAHNIDPESMIIIKHLAEVYISNDQLVLIHKLNSVHPEMDVFR
ncbi:tetratricopeptide repeat protein [Thermodesulfobacteriota bacterium]